MVAILGDQFKNFSFNFIYILAIVISVAIFVLNIQYSTFTYSSWYPLIFNNSLMSSILKVIISLILVIILGIIVKKINEKYIISLIVILNITTLIIRLFIIGSFDNFPVADSWHVFNGTNVLFFTNDIRPLYVGNYFALYPQQLGIVTILYPLALFFRENILGYYYSQVVIIQLTIILLTLISYKLKGIKASFITSILLNLFIPNFFVAFLIYGDLYAYFFLVLAFTLYIYSKDHQSKYRYLYMSLIYLCLVFAYLARLSTNVFIIAMIITFFLHNRFNLKVIIAIILMLSIIVVPFKLIDKAFDVKDVELGKYAFPSNTWLRLGFGYSGFDEKTPGFHDIKTDEEFKNVGYDSNKMRIINQELINDRLEAFRDFKYMFNFFKAKTTIMWTDPDFEMMTLIIPFKGSKISEPELSYKEINYGFGKIDLTTKNEFGQLITDNYYSIRKYEKIYIFSLLLLLMLMFIKIKKEDKIMVFGRLILIGFFILHLIIEIKSRYLYVCINALIFIVSLYYLEVFDKYYEKIIDYKRKKLLTGGVINDNK